jgi:TRAP-type uncharacterized transport system substrate-binding protein
MADLNKPLNVKIAVTSRGRAKVAASFFPSFFLQVPRSIAATTTVVLGESDTEMGGIGAPTAVARRKYDFNFANPAAIARIALRGQGPYKEKLPLRAIGVFPSWDRLVFAVRKDTGIHSIDEIKEQRYPLRVSTRRGGKFHGTLFAIDKVLEEYGFGFADIERWGGKVLRAPSPSSMERREHIERGTANAVFDEGIKSWGSTALNSDMRFLSVKDDVLERLERTGFSRAELTQRHYPELDRAIMTVDFSGWLFFCRQDLATSVAYAMAKAIGLVHQQIPVDHFQGGKMTMEEFCQGGEGGPLTIPLHPGAKRYYREIGCKV